MKFHDILWVKYRALETVPDNSKHSIITSGHEEKVIINRRYMQAVESTRWI